MTSADEWLNERDRHAELVAEIERLRADLRKSNRIAADNYIVVERLKAVLREILNSCQDADRFMRALDEARAVLEGHTALPAREAWGKRRPGE